MIIHCVQNQIFIPLNQLLYVSGGDRHEQEEHNRFSYMPSLLVGGAPSRALRGRGVCVCVWEGVFSSHRCGLRHWLNGTVTLLNIK